MRSLAYFQDILTFSSNHTRSNGNLLAKGVHSTHDELIFQQSGSKLWNNIPLEIRPPKSLHVFQKMYNIKNFYRISNE